MVIFYNFEEVIKFYIIYRLFADILNDTSILIEMLAPLFKTYFTFLACLSSISKVMITLGNIFALITSCYGNVSNNVSSFW